MDSPHTEPELRDWLRWASESGRVPTFVRTIAEAALVAFRADAAFAKPEIYDALEEHGVAYAIRIPANESLEWEVAEILFRPPGRPSHKPRVRYQSFAYRAGSWTKPRRSWPRSSTIPASCSREPVLSLPTWACPAGR